ncbi:MAG: sialate O-acetylesterase [Armatimonadetes bacterium]|nr:sialate O-acetylesterase [Armatimonadota bacterium]
MARADVRLPAVISEHIVLQQGIKAPLWGWADPGENVAVRLNGSRVTATADPQGRWQVRLPEMKAGGPYEMTISGRNTITLYNVAIGEVWVASGQSNMEWNVAWDTTDFRKEIATSTNPGIRMFTVEKAVAGEPQPDVKGRWEVAGPESTGRFSAVAYYFAKELHRRLGVPVGILHTSWGGTPAEAWTSAPALHAHPNLRVLTERWQKQIADFEGNQPEYQRRLAEWEKAVQAAKAEGKTPPRRPQDPRQNPWRAGGLYNAMIAPLVPYGIKGAIWYQGESNVDRAHQYRTLFPEMIRDWRRAWGQGDFPFLFVQLAAFMPRKTEPGDDAWAELREAQTMTLALPKTGMASAIDIGDELDIHPRNKREVGRRLALNALALAYGRDISHSGPLYNSMRVEGDKARLRFRHANGGLMARGGELEGFAIAGPDRMFVRADARIDGDTVVVWSDKVPNPVAVRYAWESNPPSTLYNRAGLPASPFRTDDWPGITLGKQ